MERRSAALAEAGASASAAPRVRVP
jgi:hypothetical protein